MRRRIMHWKAFLKVSKRSSRNTLSTKPAKNLMSDDLSSHFIDLVQDAVLKSFWRKNALLNFLRRHKISENFLATWQETETKRIFIARLLPKLEAHEKGNQILKQMAVSLAEQV